MDLEHRWFVVNFWQRRKPDFEHFCLPCGRVLLITIFWPESDLPFRQKSYDSSFISGRFGEDSTRGYLGEADSSNSSSWETLRRTRSSNFTLQGERYNSFSLCEENDDLFEAPPVRRNLLDSFQNISGVSTQNLCEHFSDFTNVLYRTEFNFEIFLSSDAM